MFSGSAAVQKFKTEPGYTEVNPGADARLACVVDNIGGECRWQKDGKVSSITLNLIRIVSSLSLWS